MSFIILRQTYNLCLRMFVCITTHLLGIHTLQHFQCKNCSKSMMSILFLYPQFTFLTWYILHVFVERTSLVKKYITLYYIYTLCYRTRDSRWYLTKIKYLSYSTTNILDNSPLDNSSLIPILTTSNFRIFYMIFNQVSMLLNSIPDKTLNNISCRTI